MRTPIVAGCLLTLLALRHEANAAISVAPPPADLGQLMRLETSETGVTLRWQTEDHRWMEMGLFPTSQSLISHVSSDQPKDASTGPLFPIFSVTTGTRQAPPGRPPDMSLWNTFFDNPGKRPHATHQSDSHQPRSASKTAAAHASPSSSTV